MELSKNTLKKELEQLSKEQLIEQIVHLYGVYKPIKDFYNLYLNSSGESEIVDRYKTLILQEFYISINMSIKPSFSVAKKVISDFKALNPSPELLADLMLTLPETACRFIAEYGDMWPQYYTGTINSFEAALKFLYKKKLLDKFKLRCKSCVDQPYEIGYGFEEDLNALYYEYYSDDNLQP